MLAQVFLRWPGKQTGAEPATLHIVVTIVTQMRASEREKEREVDRGYFKSRVGGALKMVSR